MAILAASAVLVALQVSLAMPLESSATLFLVAPATNQPFYLPPPPTPPISLVPSPVVIQTDEPAATRTLAALVPSSTITSTTTEYITLLPSIAAEATTLSKTSSAPSISSQPSTFPPTQSQGSPQTQTVWSNPPHMTDLSSFNILSFPNGQNNLKIITDLPPSAFRTPLPLNTSTPTFASAILQLKYPAHSISPSKFPQGGAQFYARPIVLATAHNVSLRYSVLFPPDFDWVLGGKLPGLYGGHTGCSGGSDAKDCFSTRLMWRKGGAGELYLYAPKTRQSPTLCSSPGSVCNFDYGLSIGRGSFTWASGAWTTVVQTVVLNTPGRADGWFMLDVDGRRAIERRDIFYREAPQRGPVKPTGTGTVSQVKPTKTSSAGGGLLGGILGPLLDGPLLARDRLAIAGPGGGEQHVKKVDVGVDQLQHLFSANAGENGDRTQNGELLGISIGTPLLSGISVGVGLDEPDGARLSQPPQPVGFLGIFFSSFFGGHDARYETPKNQYVWFRDFALVVNV